MARRTFVRSRLRSPARWFRCRQQPGCPWVRARWSGGRHGLGSHLAACELPSVSRAWRRPVEVRPGRDRALTIGAVRRRTFAGRGAPAWLRRTTSPGSQSIRRPRGRLCATTSTTTVASPTGRLGRPRRAPAQTIHDLLATDASRRPAPRCDLPVLRPRLAGRPQRSIGCRGYDGHDGRADSAGLDEMRALAGAPGPPPDLSVQPFHGDAFLGNVLRTPDGPGVDRLRVRLPRTARGRRRDERGRGPRARAVDRRTTSSWRATDAVDRDRRRGGHAAEPGALRGLDLPARPDAPTSAATPQQARRGPDRLRAAGGEARRRCLCHSAPVAHLLTHPVDRAMRTARPTG